MEKKVLFYIISPNLTLTPKEICWVETIQKKKKKFVVFNIKERAMVNSGNTAKPASQSLDRSLTHTHIIVPPFLSILPTRISLGFSRLISLSQGDETSLLK